MAIVFVIILIIFLLLLTVGRNKYNALTNQLDKNTYKLKPILPAGLYILDLVKYKYATNYDRRLISAINETSGPKQAQYLLKMHLANKITLILLVLIFETLVGAASRVDSGYIIFCAALVAGAFYLTDKELFDRVKKRRNSIRTAFPDFANKLVLLINAGMTVTRAWERISCNGRNDTPLQKEVYMTIQDIRAGKPEHSAYEDFAKRCRTPEITRFISVILQNIRKGNAELVPVLRVLTNDCWEMRKNIAKRFGEEASTKMLLPLMLMFLAILLIVGTPAVLALRSI